MVLMVGNRERERSGLIAELWMAAVDMARLPVGWKAAAEEQNRLVGEECTHCLAVVERMSLQQLMVVVHLPVSVLTAGLSFVEVPKEVLSVVEAESVSTLAGTCLAEVGLVVVLRCPVGSGRGSLQHCHQRPGCRVAMTALVARSRACRSS